MLPGFPALPCAAPPLREVVADFSGAQYSPKGELTYLPLLIHDDDVDTPTFARTFTAKYDNLGRATSSLIDSDESGSSILRGFGYAYDTAGGSVTRGGPDGVETLVQADEAGRVESMRRGPGGDPVMTADYTYYANGLLHTVTYGNGAGTVYEYDEANRLTVIEHHDGSAVLLRLAYTYTANSLPDTITETDAVSTIAMVDYDYDERSRLIKEVRDDGDDTRDYDLSYEYDQGGNRTRKIDTVNQRDTVYHYDLEDPATYQSANNRLVYHETFDTSVTPAALVSTTWYYYTLAGNPARIVTKPEASAEYSATRFGYAKNGRTATSVVGETWTWDGDPLSCPDDFYITFAREFRYDSGRARYLNRELDPEELKRDVYAILSQTWSDYDGDEIYGDYFVDGAGDDIDLRSFEPGHGTVDAWTSSGDASTTYFHGDHLGTLRQTTGAAGPSLRVFTAFGEPITAQGDRYGYVGAWGYQSHAELPYLHVGARYYAPASGRFVQRDPIGVHGGGNVYAYVRNTITFFVDPSGLVGPGVVEDNLKDLIEDIWEGKPKPKPAPSPAQELAQIKAHTQRYCESVVVGGIGAAVCRPVLGVTAISCILAKWIDEALHPEEGTSPAF